MNRSKIIRETIRFLNENLKFISPIYFDFFYQIKKGQIPEEEASIRLTEIVKELDENACWYISTYPKYQLFMDNIEITKISDLLVFSDFILSFQDKIVLSCEQSTYKKNKITWFGNIWFLPISEFNFLDGDFYCYSKPSRGQIGIRTEHDLQNYLINAVKNLAGWDCEKLSPRKYGRGVPDVKVKKPDGSILYIELKSPQETGVLTMDQIKYHKKT